MADSSAAGSFVTWFWAIVVIIGLSMVLLELIVGVQTGFDLVFLGSAFILGGLLTWALHSWILTLIATSAICLAYMAFLRRYVHRLTVARKSKTNIDTIVGKTGIVLRKISRNGDGRVKVANEDWKAKSAEELDESDGVVVLDVTGVTLIVAKNKGGAQKWE